MRAIAVRSGAAMLKTLEDENKKISAELIDLKGKNDELSRDNSKFIDPIQSLTEQQFPSVRLQKGLELIAAERNRNKTAEVRG